MQISKVLFPHISASNYGKSTEIALDLETMALLLLRLAKVPKEEAADLAPALYWLRKLDKSPSALNMRKKIKGDRFPHYTPQQLRAKMEDRLARICTLLDLTREELENVQ